MNQWELKTWRLGLGLTQKQAAEALGLEVLGQFRRDRAAADPEDY